jgi:hypothetical protein
VLTIVPGGSDADDTGLSSGSPSLIDQIVREGARRMLAEALRAEVDAYIAQFADQRDEAGRRLVVRNGTHPPREVLTSAGAVEVVAPRVNDRRIDPDTGERCRFSSAILPPWCRKTPKITEVLPLLYLHGLSSGDFVPALGQFLGSTAGLSGPVITPSRRSPTTSRCCSRSTTSPPNTGSTCAQRMKSSTLSGSITLHTPADQRRPPPVAVS